MENKCVMRDGVIVDCGVILSGALSCFVALFSHNKSVTSIKVTHIVLCDFQPSTFFINYWCMYSNELGVHFTVE